MDTALGWLQATTLAATVGESTTLTAALSACHALGFTFVLGGALFSNLRLLGLLFPGRPRREMTGPGSRLIALGLTISVPTGILLLAPRAVVAGHNASFQLKMALLVAAAFVQFALHTRASARDEGASTRVLGAVGLGLWLALALAAFAFILLE